MPKDVATTLILVCLLRHICHIFWYQLPIAGHFHGVSRDSKRTSDEGLHQSTGAICWVQAEQYQTELLHQHSQEENFRGYDSRFHFNMFNIIFNHLQSPKPWFFTSTWLVEQKYVLSPTCPSRTFTASDRWSQITFLKLETCT